MSAHGRAASLVDRGACARRTRRLDRSSVGTVAQCCRARCSGTRALRAAGASETSPHCSRGDDVSIAAICDGSRSRDIISFTGRIRAIQRGCGSYQMRLALFVCRDVDCLNCAQLAVVGSRNPTPSGRETAFDLARALAQHGLITTGIGSSRRVVPTCADNRSLRDRFGSGLSTPHRELAEQIAA